MFDVARSDVIGQQHNLVGPQIVFVFGGQIGAWDAAHQIYHKISSSRAGVENFDIGRRQRFAPLRLQNAFDARAHPIDNRLRRVNDAHRIGDFGRVALKKSFVKRVEKRLFLGVIGQSARAVFDGFEERVEAFQKVGAVPVARSERVNHRVNFARDDVVREPFIVLENVFKQTLG